MQENILNSNRGNFRGARQLLKSLNPEKVILDLATDILRDIWEQQRATLGQIKKPLQKDAPGIEKQINHLVDRVMTTDSPALITAYEAKIKELEAQKITLAERAEKSGKIQGDFKTRHRTALALLSNPWILWNSEKFEDRRAVIKLVFSKRIPYSRNSGF